jgi:hypothetical protein
MINDHAVAPIHSVCAAVWTNAHAMWMSGDGRILSTASTSRAHTFSRLSSTGPGRLDASVLGHCTLSSPASTVAMTTDENLYSETDNEQNDQQVDCVDNPPW